jgi:hypothetical protein
MDLVKECIGDFAPNKKSQLARRALVGSNIFPTEIPFPPGLPHPDLEDRGGRDARPILNRV